MSVNLNMIQLIQGLQQEMNKRQEQLKHDVVRCSSNEAVKVTVNGRQEVLAIDVNPAYLAAEQQQQLQGLLIQAINSALTKSAQAYEEQMKQMAQSLNLPNLPDVF